MRKIVYVDENVKSRFKRRATKILSDDLKICIKSEDIDYLETPPDYLIECIDIDIIKRHHTYLRRNTYTNLTIKKLDNNEYQPIITSDIYSSYALELLEKHTDEGHIINKNEAIELITWMLADGFEYGGHY